MADLRKTVTKSVAVAILALGSYVAGYLKNPTYAQLPQRAQIAVRETHAEVTTLLRDAVAKYKRGDWKGAIAAFKQAKQLLNSLEKIDPRYRAVEATFETCRTYIERQEYALEELERMSALLEEIKKIPRDRPTARLVNGLRAFPIGFPPDLHKLITDTASIPAPILIDPELRRALYQANHEDLVRWREILQEVRGIIVDILNRGSLSVGDSDYFHQWVEAIDGRAMREVDVAIRATEQDIGRAR